MTETGTLTFQRRVAAAPDRVYAVLTGAKARTIWGPPDAESVVLIENQPDPAPGVREASRCGPRDNPYVDVTTDWVVLEPPARVVYVETLSAEGETLGVSLAAYDIAEAEGGAMLDVTIQILSYAGPEMIGEFRAGWTHAMDNLTAFLTDAAAEA